MTRKEYRWPLLTRRQFLKLAGAAAVGAVFLGSVRSSSSQPVRKRLFPRHYDFLAHFPETLVQAPDSNHVKAGEIIHVAGEGRFCLFEHPPAQVVFPAVPVHQDGRLEFGVGISQDAWDRTDDGVHFLVEAVDQGGRSYRLYERHLDPRQHPEDRRWFDETVDLGPFAGQRLQIIFHTEPGNSDQYDWSAWSTPFLLSWEQSDSDIPERPNILLITIDTLRADHLSCYGYPRQTSPNLDRLARQGVRFARAYSHADITLPSHSTILTGLHPRTHGVIENSVALPREVVTLSELLQGRGYRTVGVTSAYLLAPLFNIDQGFADFYPCMSVRRPGREASDIALEWLIEQVQEPFFMWIHYFDPHAPYLPPSPYDILYSASGSYAPYHLPADQVRMPDNWRGWYKEDWPPPYEDVAEIITQYDGAIAYADTQLARLLAWLEENGLADRTLVMVTADHGEGFGEHGVTFEHLGAHEEMVHVPLIMSYPPRLPSGTVVENLVGHVDLCPTLLDLLGVPIPREMQGISLVPLLEGRYWQDQEGIISQQRNADALSERTTDWRLILQLRDNATWPLYPQRAGQVELYDLRADPEEAHNLWPATSQVARNAQETLSRQILRWKEATPLAAGEAAPLDPEVEKMLHDLGY
jgi:arylsulfatase